jgi:hypothetical protein
MKYWIFQNNEVCGPYDPDDLCQLPGYSAEALVCPEGRKGTRMGDWQRAGMVPALSISLVKATQLTAAGRSSSPASAIYAGLPPEPTLKDLAALGSLQEKVALLESAIAQFQEGMQSKETELLSLHREIDVRKGIEADLNAKIQEFEGRLSAVGQLRETIDNAVAAEKSVETEVKSVESEVKGVESAVHGVESSVQDVKTSITGVSGSVKDLEAALEKQSQNIAELMADIQRLKSERAAAAAPTLLSASEPPKPEPLLGSAPAPLTPLGSTPAPLEPLGSAPPPLTPLGEAPAAAPAEAPAPAIAAMPEPSKLEALPSPLQLEPPPPSLGTPPAPLAPLGAPATAAAPLFPGQTAVPSFAQPFGGAPGSAAPEGSPFAAPERGDGAASVPLAPPSMLPGLPAAPPQPAAVKPAVADIAAGPAKPPSKKKGLVLALVAFGLIAGGVLAFQAGLIPGLAPASRRASPAESAPLPPPDAPGDIAPQAASPEAQAEELKRQAIELVKTWPSSDKSTLVGQRLDASAAPDANPDLAWMAEKLAEGTYQVNYYGGKSDSGKQTVHMFQADLTQKTVAPYNDDAAAKVLLFGEPPAAKGKKVRVKPKEPALTGTPAAVKPSRESLDQMLGVDDSVAPPDGQAQAGPDIQGPGKPARRAPRRQAAEEKKPAKAPDDAQLLDDLLE